MGVDKGEQSRRDVGGICEYDLFTLDRSSNASNNEDEVDHEMMSALMF